MDQTRLYLTTFNCGRCLLLPNTEGAMHDFQIGRRVASDLAQPGVPSFGISNAVAIAESVRVGPDSIFCLDPAQHEHADLRSETRSQVYSEFDWVDPTLR